MKEKRTSMSMLVFLGGGSSAFFFSFFDFFFFPFDFLTDFFDPFLKFVA